MTGGKDEKERVSNGKDGKYSECHLTKTGLTGLKPEATVEMNGE